MIVDFQHHFTPRELIKEDPGDRLILHYDAQGAPSYTIHRLLYDLDEHVAMMDLSGIDAAWLTSAQGMCADLETSRFVNDQAQKAARDYPGRFIGAAHANPLGGPEALKELNRCRHDLGCEGVVITSETEGYSSTIHGSSHSGAKLRGSACLCSCTPRSSSITRSSSMASTRHARLAGNSR